MGKIPIEETISYLVETQQTLEIKKKKKNFIISNIKESLYKKK